MYASISTRIYHALHLAPCRILASGNTASWILVRFLQNSDSLPLWTYSLYCGSGYGRNWFYILQLKLSERVRLTRLAEAKVSTLQSVLQNLYGWDPEKIEPPCVVVLRDSSQKPSVSISWSSAWTSLRTLTPVQCWNRPRVAAWMVVCLFIPRLVPRPKILIYHIEFECLDTN